MGFYDDMQNLATDLLTEFNQGGLTLVRVGAKSGPGWKPNAAAETQVTLQGTASGISKQYEGSSLAVGASKQVIVSGSLTPPPAITDFMIIGTERFKITGIATKPETGVPVAYVIFCARGG